MINQIPTGKLKKQKISPKRRRGRLENIAKRNVPIATKILMAKRIKAISKEIIQFLRKSETASLTDFNIFFPLSTTKQIAY